LHNRKDRKMKYCQSHKCHTYDTKDRKRGVKGHKTNQTRRRSEFYYGGGNFCSLNCYDDWSRDFMDRAIDQVSGRIHEPYKLTEENAWRKNRGYTYVSGSYENTYCWRNMISGAEITITREEFQTQDQPIL